MNNSFKDNKFLGQNFGEAGKLIQANLNFGNFIMKGLERQVDYIKELNIIKMKIKNGKLEY